MHIKDIERIQQEVHTANHIKMYEKQKQSKELEEQKKLGYEVGRLQMKHANDLLESKINPTLDDYINVKHKSLFERLKGLFT